MTTIAIGSRWQRKWSPSSSAKVIHAIDHKLHDDDQPTRWIIYEEINSFQDRTRTGGMGIMSKSNFLHTFEHPPSDRDPEIP